MSKLALTGGLMVAMTGLTAVMLVPRPAAAGMAVSVTLPTVQVSVNGPKGPPPGPGYVWEPESQVLENGVWVRRGGYWRPVTPPVVAQPVAVYDPGPQEVIEVDVPPPAPLVEVRPAVPVHGAVWIPGYWQWHRHRHVWVTGRWSAPRPAHVWEAQRWYRHGHRWAYAPGHWRPVGGQERGWDRGRDRGRDRDHDRGRDHRGDHDRAHHGRRDHGRGHHR